MKIFLSVLTLIVLVSGCSKDIVIDDAVTGSPVYSMFGEVPERRFYIPLDVTDSLRLLWQEEVHGSFAPTSVTAFSNYLFVPDLSGRIYSFNLQTGKKAGLLKHKGVINPAPIVQLNKIIFPVAEIKNNKTTIRVYDFKTGKEIQSFDIKGIILSEIIKLEDGFIFVTENGKVMRYNYTSGKIWEYLSGSFVHSSPALSNNLLVFGNDKGEVIILDAEKGKLTNRKTVSSGFEGGFTISGSRYYAGDVSGTVFCGDLKSGEILWSFKTGKRINTIPVLDDNYIYTCNLDGDVYKLEKEKGTRVWHTKTDGILNVTPLAFKNYIFMPGLNKKLFIIDTENGEVSKTMNFKTRTKLVPVFYQNILILGADDGKIYAYEFVN